MRSATLRVRRDEHVAAAGAPPTRPVPPPRDAAAWAERVATVTGRAGEALLAWLVVGLVLALFAPRLVHRVSELVGLANVPSVPSVFSILLVAVATWGLLRRLRMALWFVVLVWQGLTLVTIAAFYVAWLFSPDDPNAPPDRVPGIQVAQSIVSAAWATVVIIVLFLARSAFPARLRRRAVWPALGALGIGVVNATLLGFVLLQAWPGTLGTGLPRLRWAAAYATGLRSTAFAPAHGHGPGWVGAVVGVVSGAGLAAALLIFLHSRRPGTTDRRDDDLAVRELLLRYPGDSLGYFATRSDRSTVFSADRRAAVSYRVQSGVCLAAGDPLGDPERWSDAIGVWLHLARVYGWVPAATSVSEAGARAYQAAGLRPMVMGDEAVVVVADVDLSRASMAPVRRAARRPRDAGYTVRVRRQSEVPADELAGLIVAAAAWRHGDERGFSMALDRMGAPYDPRVVVVSAHDRDGRPRGVLTFVPWERHGLSLDVMRRAPHAEPGVTELMVTELVATCGDLGVDRVSLNFAVFRETFEAGGRVGASLVQRWQLRTLRFAGRFWQLESLYRSNEKYLPVWQPRLLCFEASSQLPQVVMALGQAEGFLPSLPSFLTSDETSGARTVRDQPEYTQAVVEAEQRLLAVAPPVRRLTQQQQARHAKLAVLRAAGMDPYPVQVPRTTTVKAAHDAACTDKVLAARSLRPSADSPTCPAAALAAGPARRTGPSAPHTDGVSVVGRVVRLRDFGGVVFAVLREGSAQVQALLAADALDADALALFRHAVDLGDQVSVTGATGRSRSGEPSLLVTSWTMASKALVPPPDKHAGLADPATRVRLRHMELALDDGAATRVRARSAAVASVRTTLAWHGFMEVETPVLQRVHGGASARPFRTHINAYDQDLYLRIAPELYLKRLMVGGLGKVFEVGRSFRNEGADATHNPEFTSLEAYQAYGDYTTMRLLTQEIVRSAAIAVHGAAVAHRHDGTTVRLDGPDWPVVTVHDAVSQALGTTLTPDTPLDEVRAACRQAGVAWLDDEPAGVLVTELYDRLVEPTTVAPVFYTDFPVETSPLTRAHRTDPRLAERWDLVAFGAEIGTAYSELVDPVEQRRRLTAQSVLAAAGDPEAMELDEEFLTALEFGMPPTGGLGLGIDRMVMMLLGAPIRDVLTFPFVRPSGR